MLEQIVQMVERYYLSPQSVTSAEEHPFRYAYQLEKATRHKCSGASRRLFVELLRAQADFSLLALLQTSDQQGNCFRNPFWKYHEGVLMLNGGEWTFVSPANFEPGQTATDKIHTAPNLESLLDIVQQREGGLWPSPQFIQHSVSEGQYSPPEQTSEASFSGTVFLRNNGADTVSTRIFGY